jgi:beta-glucosidase
VSAVTFSRGVTLPTAVTLGHAATSNLGPTAGNDFSERWRDDLALLGACGAESIRLNFDWARLQPRSGDFAPDWVEWYETLLGESRSVGLAVWATLYDAGVPRWFDDEGGLGDDEATIRWWPRFVERVAESFGDAVDGCIPFAVLPSDLPLRAWEDTWGILGGGRPPVATSFSFADGVGDVSRRLDSLDIVGITLDPMIDPEANPSDDEIRITGDRWADALYAAADAAASKQLLVTEFSPNHRDPDVNGRLVERLVEVVDAAVDDGLGVTTCFVDPAIAGPDSDFGLFDSSREPTPAASVYLADVTASDVR